MFETLGGFYYFCVEMQQKTIIETTADGLPTLYLPELDEHYHSIKGALTEARHVYIDMALRVAEAKPLRVLEIGFGTGLNAFLTWLVSQDEERPIDYTSFELFPLATELALQLNYPRFIAPEAMPLFEELHRCEWERRVALSSTFSLCKRCADFTSAELTEHYDVVYFDAFAPEKQPEMWSEALFQKLYEHLTLGGLLTTYCAKGEIRRRLQTCGFRVERLPGPPNGKREILRATKPK